MLNMKVISAEYEVDFDRLGLAYISIYPALPSSINKKLGVKYVVDIVLLPTKISQPEGINVQDPEKRKEWKVRDIGRLHIVYGVGKHLDPKMTYYYGIGPNSSYCVRPVKVSTNYIELAALHIGLRGRKRRRLRKTIEGMSREELRNLAREKVRELREKLKPRVKGEIIGTAEEKYKRWSVDGDVVIIRERNSSNVFVGTKKDENEALLAVDVGILSPVNAFYYALSPKEYIMTVSEKVYKAGYQEVCRSVNSRKRCWKGSAKLCDTLQELMKAKTVEALLREPTELCRAIA